MYGKRQPYKQHTNFMCAQNVDLMLGCTKNPKSTKFT